MQVDYFRLSVDRYLKYVVHFHFIVDACLMKGVRYLKIVDHFRLLVVHYRINVTHYLNMVRSFLLIGGIDKFKACQLLILGTCRTIKRLYICFYAIRYFNNSFSFFVQEFISLNTGIT